MLRKALLIPFALALLTAHAGQAQQKGVGAPNGGVTELPARSKRYALVIGVDQYSDRQIGTLWGASNDARALADALVRYAGFPEDQVILLASDQPLERQPTRTRILHRLSNLAAVVPKDGLLLVSFSGHGIERSGQAFLLPSDAQVSNDVSFMEETAVSVSRMKERIRAANVRQVLILLDACRNDPGGRADAPNLLTRAYVNPLMFDVANREVEAFATLYATAVGQRAYEYTEKKLGYFTWALVEGLKGAAADGDGQVTLASLVGYVQEVVPKRIALDLGGGREQRPFAVVEGYKADSLLVSVGAGAPVAPPISAALEDEAERMIRARDFVRGLRAAGEAARLNPQSARAYRLLASAYYNMNEGEKGKAMVDRARALLVSPRGAGEFEARGYVYSDQKEYDRALADYTEAIRLDPGLIIAYNNRGSTYHTKGELDRALADYNEAIRLDPNFTIPYFNRGNIYYDRREYDRAVADYTEAIRLDPKYAAAYYNRGNVYNYVKKDYDRAVADYSEAIRFNPRDAAPYVDRGIVYHNRNDYDRAVADFTEAIRLDPKNAAAYYNRGNVYYDRKEYDPAIAEYGEAIRLDPKNAPTYSNRGNAYRSKGELDRAMADYNEAIRLDPKDAVAYNNRANVYYDRKEYDRAVLQYTESIRLDPRYVLAYKNRALAYDQLGDAARAKADRDKAAELENRR